MWLFITKIFAPILAAVIGSLCWKKLNAFNRLFLIQVVMVVVFLLSAEWIIIQQKSAGLSPNNQWLFNISLLIETALFVMAIAKHSSLKYAKQLGVGILVLFLGFYLLEMQSKGFKLYFSSTDSFQCTLFMLVFGYILYDEINKAKDAIAGNPLIWLLSGLIIYYICSIPYFSIFSALQSASHPEHKLLFQLINGILANIRYIFLAISFWLIYLTPATNLAPTLKNEHN